MVNQRSKIIYCSWKQEIAWLCSFDHCGITSSNLADYGSQLRHFARTNELVDDNEPVDPAITDNGDGLAFDVYHGDELEEEGALGNSDNDKDEEEREG